MVRGARIERSRTRASPLFKLALAELTENVPKFDT